MQPQSDILTQKLVKSKQLINESGLSIRKFAIKLDQFSGANQYVKVGMTSKIIANFYQVTLTKDEQYKKLNRAYQANIGQFGGLETDLKANQLKSFSNKI